MESKRLIIVKISFSAFGISGRHLQKTWIEKEVYSMYRYKMRIRIFCPTAIFHSIEWFEAISINRKELSKPNTIITFEEDV